MNTWLKLCQTICIFNNMYASVAETYISVYNYIINLISVCIGHGIHCSLHCLGFSWVANTPNIMANTVKPWAKIRPLINSWDCLVLPWWKARSPYARAPAVPRQPGREADTWLLMVKDTKKSMSLWDEVKSKQAQFVQPIHTKT